MAVEDPKLKKLEEDLAKAQKSIQSAKEKLTLKQKELIEKQTHYIDIQFHQLDDVAAPELAEAEKKKEKAKQALKPIWADYTSNNNDLVSLFKNARNGLKNAIKDLSADKIDAIPQDAERLAEQAIGARNPAADELSKQLKKFADLSKAQAIAADKVKGIKNELSKVQSEIDEIKAEIKAINAEIVSLTESPEIKKAQAALDEYKAQKKAEEKAAAKAEKPKAAKAEKPKAKPESAPSLTSEKLESVTPQNLETGQPIAPVHEMKDESKFDREAHDKIRDTLMDKSHHASLEYPDNFLKDEHGGEDYIPLSNVSGEEAVKKLYFPLVKMFSKGQKTVLTKKGAPGFNEYTSNSYREINNWLRGFSVPGNKNYVKRVIEDIDKAVEGTISPVNIIVQRGVDGPDSLYGNLKPGDIFPDDGIISTSLSVNGAFAKKYALRIRIRAGSVGAFAPMLSEYAREAEIILPRRSFFLVREVRKEWVKRWKGGQKMSERIIVIYCDLLQRSRGQK